VRDRQSITRLEGKKMKLGYPFAFLASLTFGIVFCPPLSAQEKGLEQDSIWNRIKSERNNLLDKSIKITSDFFDGLVNALDAELKSLRNKQIQPSEIDVKDKIDNIRIYVESISGLKKKEISASSFALISKSKKDYRD
jgi:hypothetical protein